MIVVGICFWQMPSYIFSHRAECGKTAGINKLDVMTYILFKCPAGRACFCENKSSKNPRGSFDSPPIPPDLNPPTVSDGPPSFRQGGLDQRQSLWKPKTMWAFDIKSNAFLNYLLFIIFLVKI